MNKGLRFWRKYPMIKIGFVALIFLLPSKNLTAQEKTFIREYTYKAGELDSKISCRSITINQLRSILLQEVGSYIRSEQQLKTSEINGKFNQDFLENIATISAGITKFETLEETWNGEQYWMKASITLDPKMIESSLQQIANDDNKIKQIKILKNQLEATQNELLALKEDLYKNPENKDQLQKKYDAEITKLPSLDQLNAEVLISKGDYLGAIEMCTRIIEIDSTDAKAFATRAVSRYYNNDFGGAWIDLNKVIKIDSFYYQAYLNRALVKSELFSKIVVPFNSDFKKEFNNDSVKLYKALNNLIGSYPIFDDVVRINSLTEWVHFSERHLDEESDYDLAVKYCKNSDEAYYARALYLKGYQHRSKEAIEDLDKAIQVNKNNAQLYFERAMINRHGYYITVKDTIISDLSKAIKIDPSFYRAFLERGIAKESYPNRDHLGAIIDFTSAIKLDPTDYRTFYYRADSKRSLGDWDGAISDYNEAIKLFDEIDNVFKATLYYQRAYSKYYSEDLVDAIADCNEAIRIDSKFYDAYFIRGDSKRRLGDKYGAVADYTKSIDVVNRKDIWDVFSEWKVNESYCSRGQMKTQMNDYVGAMDDFNRAIKIYDGISEPYYYRGMLKIKLGQNKNACIDFSKAGELGYAVAYDAIQQYCR